MNSIKGAGFDAGPPRWILWGFSALVALWFLTLGTRSLLDPDEGRYAEISREMLISGNWVTPHLDGVKYFEKPPLQYWMTALAYKAFGQTEFSVRLWIGLTSFAGILFAWFAAARLFNAMVGWMASLILASSLMYAVAGHIDTLDMSLAFFTELAVFGFLLAQRSLYQSRAERGWMIVAWAATALGFLTKGPIAMILPALTLITYTFVTRDLSAWKRLHWLVGLSAFTLIAAPWFVLVSRENPEFLRFFFFRENVERYLTPIHDRDAPWWYFLPLLFLGAMPWTALWLACFRSSWRVTEAGFQTRRFLWIWVFGVMIFFSASHSKLSLYIVPLFPTIAMLTADGLSRMLAGWLRVHLFGISVLFGLLTLAICLVPNTIGGDKSIDMVIALRPVGAASFAIIGGAAAISAALLAKRSSPTAVGLFGLATALALCVLIQGSNGLRLTRSAEILSTQLRPRINADSTIYSVDQYEQTIPFYLGHLVQVVGFRGELDFGLNQKPSLWVADVDEFLRLWVAEPHPIAIMTPEQYEILVERGTPMKIVAKQSNLIAVGRP